jgi:plasmid stabilization system protein ParE
LDDIKEQVAHITADNPSAARRVADRIRDTGAALGDRATGRPGRVAGTYEKLVVGLPYIIAYSITNKGGREVISILRVIHTARDWPAEEWPE